MHRLFALHDQAPVQVFLADRTLGRRVVDEVGVRLGHVVAVELIHPLVAGIGARSVVLARHRRGGLDLDEELPLIGHVLGLAVVELPDPVVVHALLGDAVAQLREQDRGVLVLLGEATLKVPFAGFPVQMLHHEGEHLIVVGGLELGLVVLVGAVHEFGRLEAVGGILALITSLRAEEVPLGGHLVEGAGRRDPARAGAAVLHYLGVVFGRKEDTCGAARHFELARLVGVEHDVVQDVVFYFFIVYSVAAVAAGVRVHAAQEVAVLVIDVDDLLGNKHAVAGNVEHDGLTGQLFDLPAGLGKVHGARVHVDGRVVRIHGRIDRVAVALMGLDHRLVRVGCGGGLEFADQSAHVGSDPVLARGDDRHGEIVGVLMDAVIFLVARQMLIGAGLVEDGGVDVRLGGVGGGKVHTAGHAADVERDLSFARSVHVDARAGRLVVGVDRKVRLGVVVAHVAVGHHAEFSALAQHVVGADGLVVLGGRQYYEVGDGGPVRVVVDFHVHALLVARVVGDGVILVADLHGIGVAGRFAFLGKFDAEAFVAGDGVAGVSDTRPVKSRMTLVAGLIFHGVGDQLLAVRRRDRGIGHAGVRIAALRGGAGNVVHLEGVGAGGRVLGS